MSQRL